jgi:hypothetical protein
MHDGSSLDDTLIIQATPPFLDVGLSPSDLDTFANHGYLV